MVKNPPANAGDIRDVVSIPELGRSPEGGHGNLLQYSCLENPMDRGAWWAKVHRVTKSQTWLKRLSMHRMHIPEYIWNIYHMKYSAAKANHQTPLHCAMIGRQEMNFEIIQRKSPGKGIGEGTYFKWNKRDRKKKKKHTEWYHLYVESSKIKKKENSQKHKVDNWLPGA